MNSRSKFGVPQTTATSEAEAEKEIKAKRDSMDFFAVIFIVIPPRKQAEITI